MQLPLDFNDFIVPMSGVHYITDWFNLEGLALATDTYSPVTIMENPLPRHFATDSD
jgi:hypothetical protein